MTKSYWLKKISIPNADLFLEYIRTVLPWIKSVGGVVVKRDILKINKPSYIDGLSFLPLLTNKNQEKHEILKI